MAEAKKTRGEATPKGRRTPLLEELPGIISKVADGLSLRSVCREMGLDPSDTHRVLTAHPVASQHYAYARELRGEGFAEEVVEIGRQVLGVDEDKPKLEPDRARVAIDALKWAAGRMAPKTMGDRQAIDLTLHRPDLTTLSDTELDAYEQLCAKLCRQPIQSGSDSENPGGAG